MLEKKKAFAVLVRFVDPGNRSSTDSEYMNTQTALKGWKIFAVDLSGFGLTMETHLWVIL